VNYALAKLREDVESRSALAYAEAVRWPEGTQQHILRTGQAQAFQEVLDMIDATPELKNLMPYPK